MYESHIGVVAVYRGLGPGHLRVQAKGLNRRTTYRISLTNMNTMQRRNFVRVSLSLAVTAGLASITACGAESPEEKAKQGPLSPAELLDAAAKEAAGFTVGSAMTAKVVYVFFDAQCPHCQHYWVASQPLLTKLRMKWIPVGLLNRMSFAQGAAILGAPDPAAAMHAHELSVAANKGGIETAASLNEKWGDKVKANTKLFTRGGAESIPFSVFVNPVTRAVETRAGSMTTEALQGMMGL